MDERKVSWPSRELNHDSSVVQPVAQSLYWLHLSSHSICSASYTLFQFCYVSQNGTEDNTACCQNIRIDKWNVHRQQRLMGPFKQNLNVATQLNIRIKNKVIILYHCNTVWQCLPLHRNIIISVFTRAIAWILWISIQSML